MNAQVEQMRLLRERMTHMEGLREGLREAVTGSGWPDDERGARRRTGVRMPRGGRPHRERSFTVTRVGYSEGKALRERNADCGARNKGLATC